MHIKMGCSIVVLGVLLLVAGEPVFGGKTTVLMPEPGYQPKVGDRAVLFSVDAETIPSDLWCATTSQDCRNFITSLFAEDAEAADGDKAGGTGEDKIVQVAPKTDVLLLARESVEIRSPEDGMPLKCHYFAIQVLSGPFQGKTLYTLDFHITRLVEPPAGTQVEIPGSPPEPTPLTLPPAPLPITPEPRDVMPRAPIEAKVVETTVPPARIELETPHELPETSVRPESPVTPAPSSRPASTGLSTEASTLLPQTVERPNTDEPESQSAREVEPDHLSPMGGRRSLERTPATPTATPPPITLETPNEFANVESVTGAQATPPAAASTPIELEIEQPQAAAPTEDRTPGETADSGSPHLVPESSTPAAPADLAPGTGPAPNTETLSSKPVDLYEAPSPRVMPETPARPEPAPPTVELVPTTDDAPPQPEKVPAISRLDAFEAPANPATIKSPSRQVRPSPLENSQPRSPLARNEPAPVRLETRESRRSAPAPTPAPAIPPRVARVTAEPVNVPPRIVPRSTRNALGFLSAPAMGRPAPELLVAAKEKERTGHLVDALVAYRTLERMYPGQSEARIAAERVKFLTEKLDIDSQELRAAQVMTRTLAIEASGQRELALGYYEQIVKVYPKTPTAQQALGRIQALRAKASPAGR